MVLLIFFIFLFPVCPRKPLIKKKAQQSMIISPTKLHRSERAKSPIPGNIYENAEGAFFFYLCSYSSMARTLVAKHRKTHFSYRPYGCAYCQFMAFCRTRIQSHHRKVHSDKVFKVISVFDYYI